MIFFSSGFIKRNKNKIWFICVREQPKKKHIRKLNTFICKLIVSLVFLIKECPDAFV